MSKSADCRRLFALRSRNASSWLVKHDQGFGGDGVSFQPSIAHLERSLGGCDQSPAKSAAKPAAKSAAKSAAKPAAKSAAKSAAKPRGKPLVQELVPIRLLDGKAWNLRVYLLVNASGTSHSVQLLAVDALWTERGHVKILEIEPNPAHSSDLSMPTDETHGTPHATDLLQTALTSFCQFGMRDQRCDVNACARDFDMLQAVV